MEERWEEPWLGVDGSEDVSPNGGDMSDSIVCKEMLPRSARP